MLRRILYAMCLAAVVAAYQASAQPPTKRGAFAMPFRQDARVRAPELEGGRGWLNTDKPLSIAALRGKVVLLDFWTYGCVNCMHVIPDLKRLEEKYSRQLVVIGVHSAKFENERDTENIRHIILRYGLEPPVVNDADFRIWRAYAVRAWRTLVLIDADGYVVGQLAGEGHYDVLDRAIGVLVEDARKRGTLNETPLKLALERAKTGDLPLAFPGKILADERSERLFIADSNHNRIIVTRLDGTLLDTVGTGSRGARDGTFESASFQRPQGLALDGDTLYVADTENHLIRRVDLKARTVQTVAGTGAQLLDFEVRGGPARTTPLSSPWDLQLDGRSLYVAMAGPHEIWKLDLDKQQLSVFAGTGMEARADGPRGEAAFAQPSGLAVDGRVLYVADAESNTIRAVTLEDPNRGDSQADGAQRSFYEPGGLSVARGRLYVADTNNHAVRVVDLATKQTTTLVIRGLQPPAQSTPAGAAEADGDAGPNAETLKLAPQQLAASGDAALVVDVALPAGYHLNPSAPQRYKVSVESGGERLALVGGDAKTLSTTAKDLRLPLRLPLRALAPGAATLRVRLTLYYCREDDTGTCRIKTLVFDAPVEVTAASGAPHEIKLQGRVE